MILLSPTAVSAPTFRLFLQLICFFVFFEGLFVLSSFVSSSSLALSSSFCREGG